MNQPYDQGFSPQDIADRLELLTRAILAPQEYRLLKKLASAYELDSAPGQKTTSEGAGYVAGALSGVAGLAGGFIAAVPVGVVAGVNEGQREDSGLGRGLFAGVGTAVLFPNTAAFYVGTKGYNVAHDLTDAAYDRLTKSDGEAAAEALRTDPAMTSMVDKLMRTPLAREIIGAKIDSEAKNPRMLRQETFRTVEVPREKPETPREFFEDLGLGDLVKGRPDVTQSSVPMPLTHVGHYARYRDQADRTLGVIGCKATGLSASQSDVVERGMLHMIGLAGSIKSEEIITDPIKEDQQLVNNGYISMRFRGVTPERLAPLVDELNRRYGNGREVAKLDGPDSTTVLIWEKTMTDRVIPDLDKYYAANPKLLEQMKSTIKPYLDGATPAVLAHIDAQLEECRISALGNQSRATSFPPLLPRNQGQARTER